MTSLCPACGSGKITIDPDEGYKCLDCEWSGNKDSLIDAPIPKNPHSLELEGDAALDILKQISKHLFLLIAKNVAQPLGLAIIESGLCGKFDKDNLTRLLKAGCTAAHKGILDEADKISEEYSSKRILS